MCLQCRDNTYYHAWTVKIKQIYDCRERQSMNGVIDSGLWRARYVADLKDFGEGARRR